MSEPAEPTGSAALVGGGTATSDDGPPASAPETPLQRRLRDRIRAEGPITFAAFMDAALYDPAEGYYARSPVGEAGDFVTSPHVSPAFGVLLARLVEDLWLRLERPDPFLLVEAGAGDGTLARRLLASLPDELAAAATFVAVERGAGARAKLADLAAAGPNLRMVTMVDDLSSIDAVVPTDEGLAGVVLANELFDNLPFHRLRGTHGAAVELRVDARSDDSDAAGFRFELVEAPAPDDLLSLAPPLLPGQEAAVSPAALGFLGGAKHLLSRGYLVLFDYATGADRTAQVHGYRAHRVEADVLRAPGSRDITAGIDVPALARYAEAIDLKVWGPITQRDALVNLGFGDLARELRRRQAAALDDGRGREAVGIYSARNSANMLVDPAGLGGFVALCLGFGDVPRPDLLLDGESDRPEAEGRPGNGA